MNRMTPESIKSTGKALCAFWVAGILRRANGVIITPLVGFNDFKAWIIPMAAEVVTIIAMYSLFRNKESFKSDNFRLCTLFICFMEAVYFINRVFWLFEINLFESMGLYLWSVLELIYAGLIIAVLCGLRTTVNIKTIGCIALLIDIINCIYSVLIQPKVRSLAYDRI